MRSTKIATVLGLGLALALAACDKKDASPSEPAPEKVPAAADPAEPAADPAEPAADPTEPAAAADPAQPDDPAEPGTVAPAEPAAAATTAAIGQPAPDFTLKDIDGGEFSLSAHKGKTVVLEWYNSGCPFVVHAYENGPLKEQASGAIADGVVWVNINSGAPGKQGHGDEANRSSRDKWGFSHPILVDEDGKVGRMYDAKTTPHMYVINAEGVLVYAGGLDNAPMGRVKDGGEPVNYVANALADLAAGRAVATPEAEPYGCSVKY